MLDQAFDTAERFGQREVLESVEESDERCFAAIEFETQHRAETVLLPRSERMAGMVGQPGPVHASEL